MVTAVRLVIVDGQLDDIPDAFTGDAVQMLREFARTRGASVLLTSERGVDDSSIGSRIVLDDPGIHPAKSLELQMQLH